MSERLSELQRQRALLQEHLAWLDREIAKETGTTVAAVPVLPAKPAIAPSPVAQAELSTEAVRAAEDIMARYRQESGNSARDVKKGCYLYFVFLMGALALFAATAYYLYTHFR